MEKLLDDMEGVVIFIDDVLITGKTSHEHIGRVRNNLNKNVRSGSHIRKKKEI